ncbi:MAG: flagellar basal body-associated FliL family protein [Variibacter sp.]
MATKATESERDASSEEEASAKPKKKLTKGRLIMLAAAVLLLAGGGGGAYYFFAGHKEEKVAAPAPKPPTFFDLPDVLVNLSGNGERAQFLKAKITLELADPTTVAQVQPVVPRVMDVFQVFLRQLRPTDLQGSAGTYRLKEELMRRVNAAIAPGKINAVLFKEMVVQ